MINKELKDIFNKSLRDMNIYNELRNKKMNNDFNKMINGNLNELIDEKIKDEINTCSEKINELKISNKIF